MFKNITAVGIDGWQSYALQENLGFTPAEVMLGRKLKGPLERAIIKTPDPDSLAYQFWRGTKSCPDQDPDRAKECGISSRKMSLQQPKKTTSSLPG